VFPRAPHKTTGEDKKETDDGSYPERDLPIAAAAKKEGVFLVEVNRKVGIAGNNPASEIVNFALFRRSQGGWRGLAEDC